MWLRPPTATLIAQNSLKVRLKLPKKKWIDWRYGISRVGKPQTPSGNGTVHNGTVERMIFVVAVRYAFLLVRFVSVPHQLHDVQ